MSNWIARSLRRYYENNLFSPVHLPLVLEPPGGTVLRQDVAPLLIAPYRSTEPLLLGFLLRAAPIGRVYELVVGKRA